MQELWPDIVKLSESEKRRFAGSAFETWLTFDGVDFPYIKIQERLHDICVVGFAILDELSELYRSATILDLNMEQAYSTRNQMNTAFLSRLENDRHCSRSAGVSTLHGLKNTDKQNENKILHRRPNLYSMVSCNIRKNYSRALLLSPGGLWLVGNSTFSWGRS